MDYKLKIMKKILTEVGNNYNYSQRPILQKIRNIAKSREASDTKLSSINHEIENIENIYRRIKKQKEKPSSQKIKKIMYFTTKQIIKGLELYLSAWNMLAEFNKADMLKNAEYKEIDDNNDEEYENNFNDINSSTWYKVLVFEEEKDNEEEYEKINQIDKILDMAETAENILMEAEKLILNSLSDYPLES